MIRTIAVDDEPLALDLVASFCNRYDFIQFEQGFTNTSAALQYLNKNPIELLFLDINMPAISGIDLYRSLTIKPMVIFTTSYSEYAIESYELEAVDYLLKPFTAIRFEKAVHKAKQLFDLVKKGRVNDEAKSLLLKADYGLVKVVLSDILFIEGLDNYQKIHLKDQPPVVVRMTMKALLGKLDEKEFVRTHRSYIVPVSKIESIRQKIISIGGEEIPIGKNFEGNLKDIIDKWL